MKSILLWTDFQDRAAISLLNTSMIPRGFCIRPHVMPRLPDLDVHTAAYYDKVKVTAAEEQRHDYIIVLLTFPFHQDTNEDLYAFLYFHVLCNLLSVARATKFAFILTTPRPLSTVTFTDTIHRMIWPFWAPMYDMSKHHTFAPKGHPTARTMHTFAELMVLFLHDIKQIRKDYEIFLTNFGTRSPRPRLVCPHTHGASRRRVRRARHERRQAQRTLAYPRHVTHSQQDDTSYMDAVHDIDRTLARI